MIRLASLSGAKLVSMRQCSGPGPGLVFFLFNCHQILGYWFAIACHDARNFQCVSFIFDICRLDEATYGLFKMPQCRISITECVLIYYTIFVVLHMGSNGFSHVISSVASSPTVWPPRREIPGHCSLCGVSLAVSHWPRLL